MKKEDLQKQIKEVFKAHPSEKTVIAFSDGNVFIGSKKNHAENWARSSKLTPQEIKIEDVFGDDTKKVTADAVAEKAKVALEKAERIAADKAAKEAKLAEEKAAAEEAEKAAKLAEEEAKKAAADNAPVGDANAAKNTKKK